MATGMYKEMKATAGDMDEPSVVSSVQVAPRRGQPPPGVRLGGQGDYIASNLWKFMT